MKTVKLGLIALCVIALSTQCQKNNPIIPNSDLSSVDLRSSDFELSTPRYILRSNNLDNKIGSIRAKLAELGGTESGILSQLDMMFVSSDHPDFASEMQGQGVTVAEDFMVDLPHTSATPFVSGGDNPPSAGDDDSFFPLLWGMDAIDAPQAWNTGHRGAGVQVAVLDEGFYPNHPDLAANLNFAARRNFVNLDDLCANCCSFGECDPLDINDADGGFSHATHVSGTIAAVDNNIGVIGVAPDAEIVPVKVLSDLAGGGLTSWIVQGIVYAADQGVDIINMSLGGIRVKGSGPGSNLVQEGIKMYNEAIQYAHARGVTVICSAGNSAIDFDHNGSEESFPAGSPHALSISATGPTGWFDDPTVDLDEFASYSNYGSSRIDFAAPGGDNDYPGANYFYDFVLSTSGPSSYFFSAGTSMAAPHVAGVAALIIGKNGGSMSPAHVKAALRASADDLGKKGKDPFYGKGRVNAYKAVQ